MAEGTSTYMGLAPALLGESEIKQQTAATDILTITGAASQSGDFLVLQNSTGAELLVISASGALTTVSAGATFSGAMVFSGSVSLASGMTMVVSATTQLSGLVVSITSTGALAAGAETVNGVTVVASTKSVLNDVFTYHGTAEGTAQSLLGVTSTHAPTYFLRVAASGGAGDYGSGAALANGFLTPPNFYYVSAPTTSIPMGAIKILAGSKAYYIPIIPDTGMAAS